MAFLLAGGVEMPCPDSLKINNEIIWSANTGRTSNGTMVGDVVAEKYNVEIGWGMLTAAQYQKIKSGMTAGFFDVEFPWLGITITGYRGTLSANYLGRVDSTSYYSSATVQNIEK